MSLESMAEISTPDSPNRFDGEPISTFRQVSPLTGATPTRRTELRITHDGKTLQVRLRAYDAEPGGIVARQRRRDADLLSDDHVMLVFDVDGNGRNGFVFAINPNGAQYDALIYDGGQLRDDWDALWHSTAQVEADGWSAEAEIPLAVFGTRAAATNWRFNAERWMSRGSERVRLAGIQADKEVFFLGNALIMAAGEEHAREGHLRLKPSLRVVTENAAAAGTKDSRRQFEPGLEVFHHSDSGLRTSAAINIDFGEAEADERMMNLGRFELFRPEKREFFLQDAGRFSFGGLGELSPMPYYSRRIGLDPNGISRSLDMGLKFSGTMAGTDFGIFGARVAGGPISAGVPEQPGAEVGVVRVARPLGERHRLGMIGTMGNPDGTSGSRLTGVDYQFLDSRWHANRTLEAYGWLQQSTNPELGSDHASGISVNYPNLGPTANIILQRIGEDFAPALGFLEEAGVTRGEGHFGWWHRTPDGEDFLPGVDWSMRRRLDGSERSWVFNPELEYTSAAGDFLLPEWFVEDDEVATAWSPAPGLTVQPGKYRFHYLFFMAETSPSRPLSLAAELRNGGFYNGMRNDQIATVKWQPNARWQAEAGTGRTAIRLGADSFTVRTATLRFGHTPSNTFNASLLFQWDNISHELGTSARLRWQWGYGRELFLSLDRLGYTGEGRDLVPEQSRAQLKLVWNLEQ